MKLACVVQRYGAGIAGGSEQHCRAIAERLATSHEVTVLTTTAADYVSWANAYPAGEARENGVRVLRFAVARERNQRAFADVSARVFDGSCSPAVETAWFSENGPDAPGLLQHLRVEGGRYDLVLFWTYRYATTFFGLPLVAERAVLVPTAEADPAIDLGVAGDVFRAAAGLVFLTPEEKTLVEVSAGEPLEPSATIGTGVDPIAAMPERRLLDALDIPPEFVVYVGRVDRNKGCEALVDFYQAYLADHESPTLPLVLAGPVALDVRADDEVRVLGYVDEPVKQALLAHARAAVIPSRYESLSIAMLEAWNHGTPVVANGDCDVLRGQVQRARGGVYYRSAREFRRALDWLSAHPTESRAVGCRGRDYVDREYRWPVVLERLERLLTEVASRKR